MNLNNKTKKKVYFNIRPNFRERMWDTPKHLNNICDILLPNGINQQSSIKTYNKSNSFKSQLKANISKYLINKQKIDLSIASNAELLYMWGAFPKNSEKPFIIELDNPYTPIYYHYNNYKRNKEKVKVYFEEAYKITHMSEACKNHSIELYGKGIEEKSFVTYPYISENYKRNRRDNHSLINLVFIGLDSRRKGGFELLEAFKNIKDDNLRLTFISNLSMDIKLKYKSDKRIKIIPPQSREKLLNEIYPKMDIMVFPSFHESFGVVLLEALSFGMGIITVNTYATPEIVKNNYNGKLLHHPIFTPSILNGKEIVNCVDLRIEEFYERYLKHEEFYYGLYEELKFAIVESSSEYKKWQNNSLELFHEKFSPDIWKKNLEKIIY